jgi:hypothetical protein
MKEWSKNNWNKNREKMRDSLSSWFKVVSPKGKVYNTNRLGDLCDKFGLSFVTMWWASKRNKQVSKGKAKGWICQQIIQN